MFLSFFTDSFLFIVSLLVNVNSFLFAIFPSIGADSFLSIISLLIGTYSFLYTIFLFFGIGRFSLFITGDMSLFIDSPLLFLPTFSSIIKKKII